jgi:hypothetical protein
MLIAGLKIVSIASSYCGGTGRRLTCEGWGTEG